MPVWAGAKAAAEAARVVRTASFIMVELLVVGLVKKCVDVAEQNAREERFAFKLVVLAVVELSKTSRTIHQAGQEDDQYFLHW